MSTFPAADYRAALLVDSRMSTFPAANYRAALLVDSRMRTFPAADYRTALLVAGDVSHAEGPSGHIEKISYLCKFRSAPHFCAF